MDCLFTWIPVRRNISKFKKTSESIMKNLKGYHQSKQNQREQKNPLNRTDRSDTGKSDWNSLFEATTSCAEKPLTHDELLIVIVPICFWCKIGPILTLCPVGMSFQLGGPKRGPNTT